jgi:hypothetical protein
MNFQAEAIDANVKKVAEEDAAKQMTGQEKYESDRERREAEKMSEDYRNQAKQLETDIQGEGIHEAGGAGQELRRLTTEAINYHKSQRSKTKQANMSEEIKFAVGDKVTILSVKKVGEVVALAEDGLYDVEYTDDGGVVQKKHVTVDEISAFVSASDADEGDEDNNGE